MSGRRMHSYSRSQRRNLRYKLRRMAWLINDYLRGSYEGTTTT